MAASAVTSTTPPLTNQQWWIEKATTYGKVGAVGVAVLAAAAATFMAPVTVVLSTLGVCLISAAAVRIALSGQFSNAEAVTKMIMIALAITGIALGGVALGLTPIVGQLLIGAVQATSLGSAILQLALGSFLLTSVWGYAGGLARSAIENAFSMNSDKIDNYLRAVQNGTIETAGYVLDPLCMFAFLAFKQDLKPLLLKMPQAVSYMYLYLATDEEFKEALQKVVQSIGELIVLHSIVRNDPATCSIIGARITALLIVTQTLLDKCSHETKKQCVEIILDKFPSLSEMPSCQTTIQNFLHHNSHILQVLEIDFKIQAFHALAKAKAELKEIDQSRNDASADMKALGKRVYDLQATLRELKQKHARLSFAFPGDMTLERAGEEIKNIFEQVDALANALSKKTSTDEIDMEDSVWNCLITQAQYQKKVDKLLTQLKNILGVTSNDAIDAKMDELGLGTVKSLFDKGIVTKDEFLKDYKLVRKKVLEHIRKAQQMDFRSKLYEVLSAATSEKPDISKVQTIASQALYRIAMAFSLLAPVIIAPFAALAGGVVGAIGFGAYSLLNGRASSLQDMRELLTINPRSAEAWILSIIISSTTRRTLFGFDEDSQRDLRTFINADFFGKMRLLSWEFGFSTLMALVATVANSPVRESIRGNALLGWLVMQIGPFLQGAMFSREIVDGVWQMSPRNT